MNRLRCFQAPLTKNGMGKLDYCSVCSVVTLDIGDFVAFRPGIRRNAMDAPVGGFDRATPGNGYGTRANDGRDAFVNYALYPSDKLSCWNDERCTFASSTSVKRSVCPKPCVASGIGGSCRACIGLCVLGS